MLSETGCVRREEISDKMNLGCFIPMLLSDLIGFVNAERSCGGVDDAV